MINAFASSADLDESTISITSVTAYTRRAGVTVDFTVTGVSADMTAVNAAMTDTSSSGFGQLFVAAATAAGQTVSLPTVEAMTIASTSQILVLYHLNTLEPNDFTASTTRGTALRTAAVDAFDQVQDQADSSQFTLGSVSGTRRSGVELTFVINAGVAVDINSLNAAMTSTGATGFAQVFYTKATAAGQVISMPIVTFVRWYYSASNGDSSDAFPVWGIFFIVSMVIMIVLAILVFLWQRNRAAEAAERDSAKFKDESKKAGIENAQKTIAPGIPTTKAEEPRWGRDPEVFGESFDERQPPLSGATTREVSDSEICDSESAQVEAHDSSGFPPGAIASPSNPHQNWTDRFQPPAPAVEVQRISGAESEVGAAPEMGGITFIAAAEMAKVEVEVETGAPAGGNDVLVPRQPFNTSPKQRRARSRKPPMPPA